MNESQSNDASSRAPSGGGVSGSVPVDPTVSSDSKNPNELTPEEQMALYEEDIKDTDWGHQPC